MTPKSGKAGKAVSPAKPTEPFEADTADPGEVAQLRSQQMQREEGKYGSQKVKPHKEEQEEEQEVHFIDIELLDEADQPVPGEKYKITLPDGSVASGSLDNKGCARVDGIKDAGQCEITFPDLDEQAWKSA